MGKVKVLGKITALFVAFCFILPVVMFTGCGKSLKIVLSVEGGDLLVKPGESVQLVATLKNKGKNDNEADIIYSITSGTAFAEIDATGLLSIKSSATVESKVKVVAKLDNKRSNTLEITVDRIGIDAITISSNKSTILPEGFANITIVTDPVNATDKVECEIIQGADIAELTDNKLFISESAVIGTVVKVIASSGDVTSNTLEFTVAEGSKDGFQVIMLNELTVDIHGVTTKVLTATVKDEGFNNVSGQHVEFSVRSGDELIEISSLDYDCTIEVRGHGDAVIRATLDNGKFAETTVHLIKPPTDLEVGLVFSQRQNIDYTVGNTSELPYEVEIRGTNVCKEIDYTFEKKEGSVYVKENTEGEFATYNKETKKIDFNTTGMIKVTAKSNSGSRVEATVSQEFTVNNGINVSTFAAFRTALNGKTNPGIVNIVVSVDPTDPEDGINYELVPESAGNVSGWGTITTYGNVTINGNNHWINLSDLDRDVNTFPTSPTFLSIEPNSTQPYTVEMNDIRIIGNINNLMKDSHDYLDNDGLPSFRFYGRIIKIGEQLDEEKPERIAAPCYLNMNNVDISKVVTGMRINHAVNAKISNTRVADCWSNGIETAASIIELENMTYGLCGAAGIEVTPENSNKAGVGFNQNQSVTFSGYIESTNINNGNTGHLMAFAEAYGVPNIAPVIQGACAGLSNYQISNFLKPTTVQGEFEFQFVALVFNGDDGNTSQFHAGSATNSIAHISETSPTEEDRIHQYLLVDLVVDIPGFQMNVGKALVKNWNYEG